MEVIETIFTSITIKYNFSLKSGMVKSQSWTGNLNRGRTLPREGTTNQSGSPTDSGNNPANTAMVSAKMFSVFGRSASTKSSPGHTVLDSKPTTEIVATCNTNSAQAKREPRSSSDYSIVSLAAASANTSYAQTRSKSPKGEPRKDPNDSLIDLNIKESPGNKNKTKVSILDAFDPLVCGDGDVGNKAGDTKLATSGIPSKYQEKGGERKDETDVPDSNVDEDG